MSLRLLLVVTVGAAGCAHRHLEWNAPGRIDVHVPPKDLAARAVERPEDPGERLLSVAAGPFAGGGPAFDAAGPKGSYAVGLEASVHYGDRETSHREDDFFVFPRRSVALNVGWTPLARGGPALDAGYLELQYARDGLGVAAGYALGREPTRHGLQATGFFGPLFLRANYFLPGLAELHLGVFVKGHLGWVWSR